MRYWLLILALALAGCLALEAQESLSGMRLQLWENAQTLAERSQLWEKLKVRLYPLSEDVSPARLENNINVLNCALALLLERAILYKDTMYLADIASLAQEHYRFACHYLKQHKKAASSLKYAYAQLMMLITPLINRIDRSSAVFHPINYFKQYDEIERIKDLALQLMREEPKNPDYCLLYAQYNIILTNHTTMAHACIARKAIKKAINAYQKQERKADLAWAYLWESSLYMRRCLTKLAQRSIDKAKALFPQGFLIKAAEKRLQEELPWF